MCATLPRIQSGPVIVYYALLDELQIHLELEEFAHCVKFWSLEG